MIGNEEDFTACLGFQIEGNDENLKELNLDGYRKMINEAAKTYPNFKAVATTLRTVKTATVNDWKAMCWADGEIYMSKAYDGLEIMDRVGGGDSFASGLVYDDHPGRHLHGKRQGSRSHHGRRRRTREALIPLPLQSSSHH